jgi:predicted RNase H-like HicB family nuclease
VAFNPETGTTTEGESIEEALANLREATTLYLEEFPVPLHKPVKVGTLAGLLRQAQVEVHDFLDLL